MEIEDEFSTIATLFWAAGVWKGRWKKGQPQAWRKHILEVQRWK